MMGPHGSAERFSERISRWRRCQRSVLRHHFWWFVHNCIAHPLIGVLPIRRAFRFHDYTSDRINAPLYVEARREQRAREKRWRDARQRARVMEER